VLYTVHLDEQRGKSAGLPISGLMVAQRAVVSFCGGDSSCTRLTPAGVSDAHVGFVCLFLISPLVELNWFEQVVVDGHRQGHHQTPPFILVSFRHFFVLLHTSGGHDRFNAIQAIGAVAQAGVSPAWVCYIWSFGRG
jgi:hypothetical protein